MKFVLTWVFDSIILSSVWY